MIGDYQPSLAYIVETIIQKEEEIQIQGYNPVYRNGKSSNSGGIQAGVRENIINISLELTEDSFKNRSRSCITGKCNTK